MFFEKPPYLGLFPAPAAAQCFQRQNGAQGAKLHRGRQVRKDVFGLLPDGMTPQVQQGVSFFKIVVLICQPVRDAPGQAEEPAAV